MGGPQIRRRSRIETELPPEVREGVNTLLLEGETYEAVAEWLRTRGYDISKSSVGRYGKCFFEAYQAIQQFADQSRAIVTSADDGMPMEEAVGKMLLQRVMAALIDGRADVTENSRLIADVAKLTSAHVQMAKWKGEIEKRARKAADGAAEIARKGGLSDEAAEQIRRKVLGVAA